MIVAGLVAIGFVVGGMSGMNAGLFIKPMQQDLGISQSTFGWAQSARLLGYAATGWFIGRILDRRGARLPLAVAGLALGASVIGLSAVDAGWQVVALFALTGATGLQGGGQSLYTAVPIARWFVRKRGKALSVVFIGTPLGIFVFPPLTQLFIDEIGWRSTYLVLGATGMAVVLVVALLVIRRQPSDLGLNPDGDADAPSEAEATHRGRRLAAAEYSWTREEATRSATFWRLAGVDGLRMVAMSTLGLFRVPYFIDQGVDPHVVALGLSVVAVAALVATAPVGWAVDRFQPRYVAAASTLVIMAAFVLTIFADSPAMVFLAMAFDGAGVSAFLISQGVVWPSYFGGANIGKIRGLSMPAGMTLSVFGAPATGIVYDQTGSFVPAWIVATVLLGVSALLLLVTPKPAPPKPGAGGSAPAPLLRLLRR